MDENISILIYEKEKDLNSILYQQISDIFNYETYTANDQENLTELINKKNIDIFVVNIGDINKSFKTVLDILLNKNQFIDIIGYYDDLINDSAINNVNITLLKKPFRFVHLLAKIEEIKLKKNKNIRKILIKHVQFLPNKKTLFNPKTKTTIHLTEKENYLLNYLYNKRNVELTKNELLANIWGISVSINTHTLETHVYRLKQKLLKLEPDITFSLINQNGLYSFKYS